MTDLLARTTDLSQRQYSQACSDRIQGKLAKAREDMTTGLQQIEKIAPYSPQVNFYNDQLQNLEGFEKANKILKTKLDKTQMDLGTLTSITQDIKVLITKANSGTPLDTANFQNLCNVFLNQTQTILNDKDAQGNYIFGGSINNLPPVDLAKLPLPATGDLPSTAYYQGNDVILTSTLDDGLTITSNNTANEACFSQLIHGLKLASTLTLDPLDTARLNAASNWLNQAEDKLISKKASVEIQLKQIDDTEKRHTDVSVFLKDQKAALEGVDQFQCFETIMENKMQLELSHGVDAIISRMLNDFVKQMNN